MQRVDGVVLSYNKEKDMNRVVINGQLTRTDVSYDYSDDCIDFVRYTTEGDDENGNHAHKFMDVNVQSASDLDIDKTSQVKIAVTSLDKSVDGSRSMNYAEIWLSYDQIVTLYRQLSNVKNSYDIPIKDLK